MTFLPSILACTNGSAEDRADDSGEPVSRTPNAPTDPTARAYTETTEAWGLAGVTGARFAAGDRDVVTGSSTARSGTPWTDHPVQFYENQLGGGNWPRFTGNPVNRIVATPPGGEPRRWGPLAGNTTVKLGEAR